MVDVVMVSVIYATPNEQWIVSVPLSEKMTALDAVKFSKLLSKHPEIENYPLVLGLFGKKINRGEILYEKN